MSNPGPTNTRWMADTDAKKVADVESSSGPTNTRWMAYTDAKKVADVESNPGPTNTRWMADTDAKKVADVESSSGPTNTCTIWIWLDTACARLDCCSLLHTLNQLSTASRDGGLIPFLEAANPH